MRDAVDTKPAVPSLSGGWPGELDPDLCEAKCPTIYRVEGGPQALVL